MSSFELPPTRITDPSFLEGLRVVLEPYYERRASAEEIQAVVERAETFFLSTRADLDLEQPAPLSALTSVSPASTSSSPSQPAASPSSSSETPPYPPSFAEIAQLIATGAPIPGIRTIPDQLASDAPSRSTLASSGSGAGRKPWEREKGTVGGAEVARGQSAGEVGLEGPGAAEGEEETLEESVRREEERRREGEGERAEEGSGQV
ncbi:hypothetical protein JCM8097_003854 [Rhodosporidiobolus ruineniae]